MDRGGIMLPNGAPPVMNLAQPLNDVQLVALIASQFVACPGWEIEPAEAVALAGKIVAEAVLAQDAMVAYIRGRVKEQEMTD